MKICLGELLGMDLVRASESTLIKPLLLGSKTEIIGDRLHLQIPLHGIGIVADLDRTVSTIFLYAGGTDGYHQFSGPTPEGIAFEDSRAKVQQRLGPPSAHGGGKMISGFGKASVWDRYDRDGYSLHVDYADGECSIRLLAMMRPDSIPR